jgi:glucose/arabinose dehydrogenase
MNQKTKNLLSAGIVLLGVAVAAAAIWWQVQTRGVEPIPEDKTAEWRLTRVYPDLKFERPLWMTALPGRRWLLVEQAGRIRDIRAEATEAPVFLDLTDRVSRDSNEEGLLGLALHPGFATNHRFFVYYSAATPRRSVLSEFRATPDGSAGLADTERVVLEIPQPYSNHNGGALLFGPDNKLYVSLGDGGSGGDPRGHGQNPETLLGSILRLDIDNVPAGATYGVPPDNPFANHPTARPEIWAYGLRNAWRMSFDRQTGQLWAADVGQDQVEEINIIEKGKNYGWALMEGNRKHANSHVPKDLKLAPPHHTYLHGLGMSVTGGYVYRGTKHPTLKGRYVYADFVSGRVWALTKETPPKADLLVPMSGLFLASFAEDQKGELLLLAFDGKLYELTPP